MNKYTKKMFKDALLIYYAEGYDPIKIARRTSTIFNQHQAEISLELRNLMLDVMTMEDGPEFEMNEEEFKKFLDRL